MANHASTRTTQLYDRRAEEVTHDEVERVLIQSALQMGLREPHPEPPAKAGESKDGPACADVRARWSVLRGRFAAPQDEGRCGLGDSRQTPRALEHDAFKSNHLGRHRVNLKTTCSREPDDFAAAARAKPSFRAGDQP
jgi:hypothetical protein